MNEILTATELFAAAYNRGDVDTLARYYSESLLKLRAGAPAETKAEVIRRVSSTLRDHRGHLEVQNDEIVGGVDLAFTRGHLTLTLTPRAGGAPVVLHRRFLEIWQREGGRWVVTRAMDNSDR